VVVPQSKPLRSGKILSAFGRDSSPETFSSRSGNLDESAALSSLKELIAAGDHRLDPILATITDAARQLTDASGAALAMWKEGAMVCRARSGDTAPALGAQLGAETGISGECLRTGKIHHCADTENDLLVDVEVCRSLGLRSIAVLPIQGRRGINGILEVFSTKPAAFSEQHLALLQQLAELAERARASQPHGASPAAPKLPVERPQPSGLLPASDRVGDVALAFLGTRSRPFALGAIGLVGISLLALVIWLGWRGSDKADGKAHAAKPSSVGTTTVNAVTAHSPDKHPPDNDPVWKANPGGESLFPSSGKTSAGTPVKFASKVDVVSAKKTPTDVGADFTITHEVPRSQIGSHNASRSTDSRSDETASTEPPSISAGSTNQSALNEVLSAKVSLPGLSAPVVSQGVSGGQLVHRVPPAYPAQARGLRLEGTVILAAMVMEDGTVRDVKVVEGSPVLAQSAVDAVKHWRYKPYELDGKPVKNETRITINFKLSSDAPSR
jgi:TonB family protein